MPPSSPVPRRHPWLLLCPARHPEVPPPPRPGGPAAAASGLRRTLAPACRIRPPPRLKPTRAAASSHRAPPPGPARRNLRHAVAPCSAPLSPLAPRRRTGSAPLPHRRRRWLFVFNISNSTFQHSMIPFSTFVYIVFNILLSNVEPI